MSKLSTLRSRLADVRRRRQVVRWGAAYAALALAVLWTLVLAFVLDWSLGMSKLQRLVAFIPYAILVIWAFRRYAAPWLGHRESELDIALLVEREQKIDSDLVAALQFESPDAARWGSTQLEGAVIDYVAEYGRNWNVVESGSRQMLVRRGGALVATVVLLLVAVALQPRFFGAFINRLLLGSAHYPTRTTIEELLVNGQPVETESSSPITLKIPYGRTLKLAVTGSGELPEQGRAELTSSGSGLKTAIELPASPGATDKYSGELSKLVDSLAVSVYLGDAYTEPLVLKLIDLPVIETRLVPTAPSYARQTEPLTEAAAASRQISVIEGSQIGVEVKCTNKRLTKAVLSIGKDEYPLTPAIIDPNMGKSDSGEPTAAVWSLDTSKTPFAQVTKPLRYEIQVTDEDGLQLEQPIQGFIRIKADQRPRITADLITKFVLPVASPRIHYRASDDYGLRKLMVHVQATHGQATDATVQEYPAFELKKIEKPQVHEEGDYFLRLAPFKLTKGDQVKVTLEAIDDRGDAPGQSAMSEPLVLQVTDESGVLAAISESDERSARQLDAIIKRQLGIGDQK